MFLLLWRAPGLLGGVPSVEGDQLLGRGSGVGRLAVVVSRITLWVVTSGLLLPLRVRAPNVGLDGGCR